MDFKGKTTVPKGEQRTGAVLFYKKKLMSTPPANPQIYHIIHVDRLASILHDGKLWSDAVMSGRVGTGTTIGMSKIKQERLVKQIPGLDITVGQCVPFYFCPRSVMLFLIFKANHPDLTYRGGQGSIIHLRASLRDAVAWSERYANPWAFSDVNAYAGYANFFSDLVELYKVNWQAIRSTDFRQEEVKEAKQAEFLIRERFPWQLIREIGVQSPKMQQKVGEILRGYAYQPAINVHEEWYYKRKLDV